MRGRLDKKPKPTLSFARARPSTRRALLAVTFFTLAIVMILAEVGIAGPLGMMLTRTMRSLLGWGRFIAPLWLVLLAGNLIAYEFRREREKRGLDAEGAGGEPRRDAALINYYGAALFLFALHGILHLIAIENSSQVLAVIPLGQGGGYLGWLASFATLLLLGNIGAMVVLGALLLAGFFISFNSSFLSLVSFMRRRATSLPPASQPVVVAKPISMEEQGGHFVKRMLPTTPKAVSASPTEPMVGTSDYVPPALTLLKRHTKESNKPDSGNIHENIAIIQRTFANFGIEVTMGGVNVGPTVTQYTLKPAEGVKLASITALANDLSLALAAHPIRIEAPIPGQSLVGIEVPNRVVAMVYLGDLLEPFVRERRHAGVSLRVPVGRDVAGQPFTVDIGRMPHLLVAGATGSGKSVAMNSIILSLLYQNSPDDLRFILVDPKRVEMAHFNGIPHLSTPVITEVKKAVNAFVWAIGEMDSRYRKFSEHGNKNIESYNESVDPGARLPYLVIVVDELAHLMMSAPHEVEAAIVRLAQLARAVGIHLIIATQRPSVDVITGLIKANIGTRMAFSVPSVADSRTIIDSAGAEKLMGNGDMLFLSNEATKPRRVQGVYVSEEEVKAVTDYLRGYRLPDYTEGITERHPSSGFAGEVVGTNEENDDTLLDQAIEVVRQAKKASASLLQRHLRVGYARAARMLDILEQRGVIGPGEGAKPREVYLDRLSPGAHRSAYGETEGSNFAEGDDDEIGDDGENDDDQVKPV
ncbi:MAG: DNA translocase FtsK [Parcubacteria group bacterium]|nr:DNA translocase FtsK [Parcubacteria group bacterium]